MRNKKLKKMFYNQTESFVPDILDKVKNIEICPISITPLDSEIAVNSDLTAVFHKKFITPVSVVFGVFIIICFLLTGLIITSGLTQRTDIYFDLNPSVSIKINDFGKIVDYTLINAEARQLFERERIKGLSADEFTDLFIKKSNEGGYFNDAGAYLSISASSKFSSKNKKFVGKLQKKATAYMKLSGITCTIETKILEAIDNDEKDNALHQNISPAKMKIINDILLLDSSQKINDLQRCSMKDLREILEDILDDLDDNNDDD